MKDFSDLPIHTGTFLLPQPDINIEKWATVAYDQYAAQKDYWDKKYQEVKNAPSSLHMLLPQCYLDEKEERIPALLQVMQTYAKENMMSTSVKGMILTEKENAHGTQLSLLATLDLEMFNRSSLFEWMKAPEEALLSTFMHIRKKGMFELSNVILGISDTQKTVLEPLFNNMNKNNALYDFTIKEHNTHIKGYKIEEEQTLFETLSALCAYQNACAENKSAYAILEGQEILKAALLYWAQIKPSLSDEEKNTHPARYISVNIVNISDDHLHLEPLHRVFFETSASYIKSLLKDAQPVLELDNPDIVLVHEKGSLPLRFLSPLHLFPVNTVQMLLDKDTLLQTHYVQGEENVQYLVQEEGAVGILVPAINKNTLFDCVQKEGTLKPKTFTLGDICDKKTNIETRKMKV